jgi:Acyl-CoA thioesterase C-terminal domain
MQPRLTGSRKTPMFCQSSQACLVNLFRISTVVRSVVAKKARHQRITPYTQRHNGKVCYHRILAEEFLYARSRISGHQRDEALKVGTSTSTTIGPTPPKANPRLHDSTPASPTSWPPTASAREPHCLSLQRLFAVADDVNGVGAKLNVTEWTFVNTDVVVYLHRVPEGEWTGVRAETSYGPDGVGVSSGSLHDGHGPVGIATQSILLRRIPSAR